MKTCIFFILGFLSTAYGQQSKDYYKSVNDIALAEGNAYSRLSLENATSASNNFDIKYYRCEWTVDPSLRYISGKVTSYFIITDATDNISFDLMDDLTVDSVRQSNTPISFNHVNNTVTVDFGSVKNSGILDSVTIFYQGVPPANGFGSFVVSTHEGVPVLWTLSEPYGSRDWWPCKNGLDDKTDSIDVFITNPSQYTAASNGLRQNITTSGANITTHWKHRYPIATYLVCMAVTNYAEFNTSVAISNTDLPMQTFCYPESLSLFQANTQYVLDAMQYYSHLFGDYPFIKEKYGHVQFGFGGGQEHQTSTFIVTPDESLMAHELGHQWFGDKITCGSWRDIWLNEGFATHLASMYIESKYAFATIPNRKKEIDHITSLPGGSVWVDDTTSSNRIFDGRLSYRKGSHLLYMLRWILGDSVFLKGVRQYFTDSTISFGFAKTSDLKRNLEKASGVDLTKFFDEWFYGQGYPSYHVQWTQLDGGYIKIKMNQTTSHPSVNFFELPVPLLFKNATREKTVIVDNKSNGELFFKNIGFVADSVIIDPEYWLITRDNTIEKIDEGVQGNNLIQVFPNPVTDFINIYLQNVTGPISNVKIFDARGRVVYKTTLNLNGSLFTKISTTTFAKGVYILKIEAGNSIKFAKKILKQ
ncbi:MAG: M1 family aminopeptidase [Ginsengibacter sp.]